MKSLSDIHKLLTFSSSLTEVMNTHNSISKLLRNWRCHSVCHNNQPFMYTKYVSTSNNNLSYTDHNKITGYFTYQPSNQTTTPRRSPTRGLVTNSTSPTQFDFTDDNQSERQPFLTKQPPASTNNKFQSGGSNLVSSSPKMGSKSQKGSSLIKSLAAGKNLFTNGRRDSNSTKHPSGEYILHIKFKYNHYLIIFTICLNI